MDDAGPLSVLIVEDSTDDAALVEYQFRRAGYALTSCRVETAAEMRAALARQTWDVVVSDYSLPHFSGPAAMSVLNEEGLDLPILIVSGAIGDDSAVAAMKAGAHDYIMKDNLTRLVPAVERELREWRGRQRHKQSEQALNVTLRTSADIVQAIPSGLLIFEYREPDLLLLVDGNPAAEKLFGKLQRLVWGASITSLFPGFADSGVAQSLLDVLRTGEVYEQPELHYKDDEMDIVFLFRAFRIAGQRVGVAFEDVTERVRSAERIKASLNEKEVLLREVHHRVKNNLQVIVSLLNLQSRKISDPTALSMITESQSRIRSMVLIHEKLYRSRDFAHVDFREYVESLMHHLMRSYQDLDGRVRIEKNIGEVALGIDSAIPFGMVINELVSNALKHAFKDQRQGVVTIDMQPRDGGGVCLSVKDNGVGLPEGLDILKTDSLGMQLVTTLTDQLEGTLSIKSENGTEFRVECAKTA